MGTKLRQWGGMTSYVLLWKQDEVNMLGGQQSISFKIINSVNFLGKKTEPAPHKQNYRKLTTV